MIPNTGLRVLKHRSTQVASAIMKELRFSLLLAKVFLSKKLAGQMFFRHHFAIFVSRLFSAIIYLRRVKKRQVYLNRFKAVLNGMLKTEKLDSKRLRGIIGITMSSKMMSISIA